MPLGTLHWINKHRSKYSGKVIPIHEAPKIALQLRVLLSQSDSAVILKSNNTIEELRIVVNMVTERFLSDRALTAKENEKLLTSLFDCIDKDHSGIHDFAEYLASNTSEEAYLNAVEISSKTDRLYHAFIELATNYRRNKEEETLSNPAASTLKKYSSFKKLFAMNYFAEEDEIDDDTKAPMNRKIKTADGTRHRRKKEMERSKEAALTLGIVYDNSSLRSLSSGRSNHSITSRLFLNGSTITKTNKRIFPIISPKESLTTGSNLSHAYPNKLPSLTARLF
jgi:F0F1-type ATP synthase delta subunit